MAKPILAQEAFADLRFPSAGIDLLLSFSGQRPGTTPVGLNVRAFEPSTLRVRGGSRPGLVKFVTDQLPHSYSSGSRLIQNLDLVVEFDGVGLLNNYDFDPPLIYDPSDPGPSSSWPPGELWRVPPWGFPIGGTGVPPFKNGKTTPEVVWANPSDIVAGSALSGTQLDATARNPRTLANVPGTFSYSPASGAVLDAGMGQVLNTTFTPTDTDTYNPVRGLAHINVLPPGPPKPLRFVQLAGFEGAQSATATMNDVATGDLLVVGVALTGAHAGLPSISSLTDSLGTNYVLVDSIAQNTGTNQNLRFSVYFGVATSSGPNAVTVVASGTNPPADTSIIVLEYEGTALSPFDASADGFTFPATGSVSVGPLAVSGSGELVVVIFYTASPDSPLTLRGDFGSVFAADIFPVDASSTYTGSGGSVGAGQIQIAIAASFKPAT